MVAVAIACNHPSTINLLISVNAVRFCRPQLLAFVTAEVMIEEEGRLVDFLWVYLETIVNTNSSANMSRYPS